MRKDAAQAVVFTVVNLSVAHRPEVCRDERSGPATRSCSFVDDAAKLADGAIDRKHGLAVDVGLQKPPPAR